MTATALVAFAASAPLAAADPAKADKAAAAEPQEIALRDYFPLQGKSRWSYRIRDFAKNFTYDNSVRIFGTKHVDALKREAIMVEDRYSSDAGPYVVEEIEPIAYFWEDDFLHRVFLTYQAGRLRTLSGSGEARFLPRNITDGLEWASEATALRTTGIDGMGITNHHTAAIETEVVSVPAGDFDDCIRIDIRSDHGEGSGRLPGEVIEFYYSDWYARGVGLVRSQVWDDATHKRERTRIELVNYSVDSGAEATGAEAADAE